MTSDKTLLLVYRAPKLYGGLRIGLTLLLLFKNFLGLPLVWLQLLALFGYGVALVNYSLFKNDVPIMSVFLPNIFYYTVAAVISKELLIVGFIPLALIDITFVFIVWLKAIKWPFYI